MEDMLKDLLIQNKDLASKNQELIVDMSNQINTTQSAVKKLEVLVG